MTYLLVAFLVVLVAPLLVATWRTSLVGLGLQGFLMTAMALQHGWEPTAGGIVLLADLLILRGYVVPRYLYGIMRRHQTPRRTDVVPANLFSWTLAGVLVLLSFRFAEAVQPGGGVATTHVAVACAAVLLAFQILGTGDSLYGQVVGVLRLENGIALFELSGGHAFPLVLQVGVTGILVITLMLFGRFLEQLGTRHRPSDRPPEEALP
jgi:hydrogenase-4 membrane subunit HyfE